jgi:hypothetical protein
MAASCPSQLDDDHIATGRCPSRTGHSRRDRPQTVRQPTVSRGAHYRQDPTPWAHHDSQQQSYKPFADLWTGGRTGGMGIAASHFACTGAT